MSFTYDALGRITGQTTGWGTFESSYDLAGRRTRIRHPDGFFVDYNHFVTGEMSQILEGGLALASFAHDDLVEPPHVDVNRPRGYDALPKPMYGL